MVGSKGLGILLKALDTLTLQALSDNDWAACPNSKKSIVGYILLFGNFPVSWKSKKQRTISRSSSETEYRAMETASICRSHKISQIVGRN